MKLLISEHGEDVDLRPRFKRRDHSRSNATNNKYIPPRHKIAANSEGSQMAGHLRSRKTSTGGRSTGGKWKRSWFVLKDRVLYHYRASEDTVAIETLPVLGWNLQPAHSADKVHIIILKFLGKSKKVFLASEIFIIGWHIRPDFQILNQFLPVHTYLIELFISKNCS